MPAPRILYLDTIPGDGIQQAALAGMRRYAGVRGWDVEAVPVAESRPEKLKAVLAGNGPVAGCVVECADNRSDLPPRLFGNIPVAYFHAAPNLYGGRATRLSTDNAAVAQVAFCELSAAAPAAFAVVGFRAAFAWSMVRESAFAALAKSSGRRLFAFRRIGGARGRIDAGRAARLARWLSALPARTAVFAVNDVTAAEVVAAARAAGRRIPHDLTLLGVDDNRVLCVASAPQISSIRMDFERAGFLAARMIGEIVSHRGTEANHFTVPPLLAVRRESTRGSGRREPYILTAVEIIRREACDGLTAGELAKRLPGTRRLLEMRFREAMGHSILDEIMHVRLERVQTLLAGTDTPIGAIADRCGFGSAVELRHVFRAHTKMSLREWRKRNRG